jgi:hypothetical protein
MGNHICHDSTMMCSAMQSTGYLEEEEEVGRARKEEKEHSNNRKLRRSV